MINQINSSHISRRTLLRLGISSLLATALVPNGLTYSKAAKTNHALDKDLIKEESRKQRLAKYHFNFSSPYFNADYQTTPHAHQSIKELIEAYTQHEVYVSIHDGGRQGIGSTLANSVAHGVSQGALISIANLAPKIAALDILNIPFWSASEEEYLKLFQSQVWKKHVLSKTTQKNIRVLFPYVVGARTATSTLLSGKLIRSPEDFVGTVFRIPGSYCLKRFYQLAKAKPVSIMWKLAARTARLGRYEALDPSVIGLYSGPEQLNKAIALISEIELVHDGWVAIGNTHFIDAMNSKTRRQFLAAFEAVQQAQFEQYQQASAHCRQAFTQLGVKIYQPTVPEKQVLIDTFGHTHPQWQPIKKSLLGDDGIKIFDLLYRAAKS